MTAENLAKHRLDPNIDFWKELKTGSDHFEVTKTEPSVLVCGKHYQFDAKADHDVGASAPCPTLRRNEEIESAVAAKQQADDKAVAELVAKGVRPVRLIYADGGQNPVFIGKIDASREDALAQPPQEVALDDKGQPLDPAIKITQDAESAARIVVVPTPAPQSPWLRSTASSPSTTVTGAWPRPRAIQATPAVSAPRPCAMWRSARPICTTARPRPCRTPSADTSRRRG